MTTPLQPSLPYPNSSLSYWHRTTRAFPLLNQNDTKSVPASSPYAIIGAGLTGALSAFELVESGIAGTDILILEAREAVSGSTGRNAGHCRPDAFRNFSDHATHHGPEQALKIAETEDRVFTLMKNFVNKHQVPCEFTLKQTYDVCFTSETAEDEAKNIGEYVAAGGKMDGIQVYEGDEARQKTGFDDAVAAYGWTAASLHPVKLTQWILSFAAERGVRLWTHCPVTTISQGYQGDWILHTPRGKITSQKIVHCTNAHAGVLLPQLSVRQLTPIRGQVQSLVPSRTHSGGRVIKSTMALRTSLRNFYALLQTSGDGMIIFGVARSTGLTFDESGYDDEIVKEAIDKFGALFPLVKNAESLQGEGFDHAWTGLLAFTPDRVPYVGPIPELPGQYICAGFNGHGMANIFACVPGVVKLMQGAAWEDTNLPECYRYSEERLKAED
ncbi:FAD dependent oxidoreductase [Lepidopterella palustris CBS 459.81]|uniref:FAD dependent oxidoreductase n=1 Tax=Lepidopterella palustris CBS 459.81 TaxID=1314670 RepID=A0A8E2DZZ8_9PEZI|nr:FAD dependent oxidoreductase [Lepidopterella palustris CBS 459.81]